MITETDFEKAIDQVHQFSEYDTDRKSQTAKKNTEAAAACFELAKQMQESKWIPVSERLPELDELGFSPQVQIVFKIGKYNSSGVGEYRPETKSWRWANTESDISDAYEITHWQPLPTPPTI